MYACVLCYAKRALHVRTMTVDELLATSKKLQDTRAPQSPTSRKLKTYAGVIWPAAFIGE